MYVSSYCFVQVLAARALQEAQQASEDEQALTQCTCISIHHKKIKIKNKK
jgi:hypothetical protein